MTEYCVCCGAEIPEGQWVCPLCADTVRSNSMENQEVKLCRRCGRKLRTNEAKERGYGKICWRKSRTSVEKKPLFQTVKEIADNGDIQEHNNG